MGGTHSRVKNYMERMDQEMLSLYPKMKLFKEKMLFPEDKLK
jgi:hypothetical protein